MWILSTIASTGYLSRMTQWKSKLSLDPSTTLFSDAATDKLKLGLFSYPVLQAADILLYKPTLVPVGEDQAQHIEFARTLARGFNAHFGHIPPSRSAPQQSEEQFVFDPIPNAQISPAKRIMSLRHPTQKMSKSDLDPKSRILITDDADTIRAKLKNAVTDSIEGISYSRTERPGISNLIEILKYTTRNGMSCEDIAGQCQSMSKGAFKAMVADAVVKELEGVRERFDSVMSEGNGELKQAYEEGKDKALKRAGQTMGEVRRVLGLEGF